MPKPVQLPDGTLMAIFHPTNGEMKEVTARTSKDGGRNWSAQDALFKLPSEEGGWGYPEAFVDRDGEIHIFFLNDANTGVIRSLPEGEARRGGDSRLDIWHARSRDARKRWDLPKRIWSGRAGDLQSVIQLKNGRILLPICYMTSRSWGNRGEGPQAFTYAGKFDTTVLFSDDGGKIWQQSPSILRVPTPDITTILGAIEPVLLELKNGRIWMLIRTQQGRFFESFSRDGAVWSSPQPSSILSSDSPAALTRLQDGRIVLIWNNCLRFPYAYGGRQVLHAAISEDEGATWRGYREVVRDPHRNRPPPPSGDHGISYPFPALTRDGKVIFSAWVSTGAGRALYLLDPGWLYETSQKADFSSALEEWSTFGTLGVETVPHPEKTDAKALWLRKPNPAWPAAAVWNFPLGDRGRLRMRFMAKTGFKGAAVAITDHFSVPFDPLEQFHNLYELRVGGDRNQGALGELSPDRWHTLELDWNCARRECRVSLDGSRTLVLEQSRESPGACYLRLRSTASEADNSGILIEYIEADVAHSRLK